jgi:hypothetical protein
MISYINDREDESRPAASGSYLTRRRVVDYCRVTATL